MSGDVIQHQIKLVGFKVTNFNFSVHPNPEGKDSPNKRFKLELGDLLLEDVPNFFVKVFYLEMNFERPERDEIFDLKAEYHAVFECSNNITKEFLESDFVKISAPAIGFPYLRAFISTFSLQGGLPPIVLPSINFVQFNKESDKK